MKIYLTPIFIIVFLLRGGYAQNLTETIAIDSAINPLNKAGWDLVFHDEFDGDSLNKGDWWAQEGTHGDELQYYTPRIENVFIKNGYLYLRAIKERYVDSLPYTSGEVFSSKEYGRGHLVEVRCKIPKGKGLWHAFWFWSGHNVDYQELDVFEYWSYNTRRFCVTNHSWDAVNKKRTAEYRWIRPKTEGGQRIDMSEHFFTYAAYWDDTVLKIMLNNKLVAQFTKDIPKEPFNIILNLAIYRDPKGKPYKDRVFPADFIIDYVRVYKRIGAKTITR
jgi:beta-glucanase (GH16 family)